MLRWCGLEYLCKRHARFFRSQDRFSLFRERANRATLLAWWLGLWSHVLAGCILLLIFVLGRGLRSQISRIVRSTDSIVGSRAICRSSEGGLTLAENTTGPRLRPEI